MLKIREDKWLEWCATFNAHTSLSELWRKLRIATGKLPRSPAHPQLGRTLCRTLVISSTTS
ncbi:putative pol-like 39 [Homarus americanus]|uniref:Putative pol-like 39 n=1 Tax=Homarus americanus TaxID=6706 RepID=A0A8J5JEH3_HOMAM|nr:putative pol-like 39 [Homarus americanus]